MKKLFLLIVVALSFFTSPVSDTHILLAKDKPTYTAKKDVTVYVTRTGAKYHRSGCRYLRRSSYAMKLSEARGSYSACSVCNPPK